MKFLFLELPERETRDAARLAVQSSSAAAATFLMMQYFDLPEQFLGIISAVLVVQPSIGNTLVKASDRIVATLVGSIIGIACLYFVPSEYGTFVALVASMLLINAVAGFRPGWRYGVVAAVALSLRAESDAMEAALDRGIAISAGAALGMLASLIVWPDAAIRRAHRHLRSALSATAVQLDASVKSADGECDVKEEASTNDYHSNIRVARKAAEGIRIADGKKVRELIEKTAHLYNSTLILKRVAEETSHATKGGGDLEAIVDEIRARGCDITKALAENDFDQDEALKLIDNALNKARTLVADGSEDDREHVFRSALIFGLGEVADSLRNLKTAFEDA